MNNRYTKSRCYEGMKENPHQMAMRDKCEMAIRKATARATILYFDKTVVVMYDCDINRLRRLVEEFLDVAKDIDCAIVEEL